MGSVKGNFGHLESAAGLVSLAKAALALYHGVALPMLFSGTVNPRIDLDRLNLRLVTDMARLAPAPGCDRVLCGVNSFGIAGANAFALLAAADTAPFTAPVPGARALALPPPSLPAFIVPLLATSRDALLESAAAWAAFGAAPASRLSAVLQSPPPGFEGAAIEAAVRTHCATCPMLTRGFFTHRTALVGVPGGLATAQPIADVLPFLPMTLGRKPRGGLVFGGQGALSSGAGDQLYAALPAFREAAHAFSDAYAATPGGVQLLAPRSPGAAAAASAVP